MYKNVLVTGGLGYIGSHTIVDLIENGYNPIILDNLDNSHADILDKIEKITKIRPKIYITDIRSNYFEVIFKEQVIDSVIHFAAYKSVNESILYPEKYYENNVIGTINLLNLMKKYQVKKLVFSSSCTVYGKPKSYPVFEHTSLNKAESVYGKTKQICEEKILECQPHISSVVLRYFNPIGAHPTGELYENPKTNLNNIIPSIMQSIENGKEFFVFGGDYNTKDGTALRDYININDLAQAHTKSLEYLEQNQTTKIYNVGTGGGHTVLDIINCFKELGTEINYQIVDRREGDVEAIYANIDKIKTELGWEPKYSLKETIQSILNI